MHPVELVEELHDREIFVPRVLVEGRKRLESLAHRLEVHVVGDEAILDLVVEVHLPDLLKEPAVEVAERVPLEEQRLLIVVSTCVGL